MTATNSLRERALVIANGGKRPYGAKLKFQITHAASIGDLENVSVLLDSGAIAVLQPARSTSLEGGRKFQITLDGFPTATAAESAGLQLAQALLLLATSFNFGLRLNYHGRVPATVYERFRSEGMSMWAEGVASYSAQVVLNELASAYQLPPLDPKITLSMELFCAAMLEMNERARFVTVVSALEPLAKQELLSEGVATFVASTMVNLDLAADIEPSLRASLRGRVALLRTESVRQALFRLSDSWFPGRNDLRKQIDGAYGLRSELLHNGTLSDQDADLGVETAKIVAILRSIYARASGHSFHVPSGV